MHTVLIKIRRTSFAFEGVETKIQNKIPLGMLLMRYFSVHLGFHIRTTSFYNLQLRHIFLKIKTLMLLIILMTIHRMPVHQP